MVNLDTEQPPEEMFGEYSDSVSVMTLIGVIGIWIPAWTVIGLLFGGFINPLIRIGLLLLLPFLAIAAIYRALNIATLALDSSGWTYRRALIFFPLETEEGRWADLTRTTYRQWLDARQRVTQLFGDFSLTGPNGDEVLKVRTRWFSGGNLIGNHAVAKRMIGVSTDHFASLVGLINKETPQLGYEWVPAPVDPHARGPRSFIPSAGPDRYVSAPRRAQNDNLTEAFGGHLPVPF